MKKFHYGLAACALLAGSTLTVDAKLSKPNILWVITDDHRADSVSYFNQVTTGKTENKLGFVSSPNLDKLAREGTIFTKAYCNSPGCAPSRSSMLTGKYPHRNGMYGFRKAYQIGPYSSKVIPEVMNQHGYQSSHFGKSGFYIFAHKNKNLWDPMGYYKPFISHNTLMRTKHSDYWFNKPWGKHNGKGMVLGTEEVYRYPNDVVKRFWRVRKDKPVSDQDRATQKAVETELYFLRSYTLSNPTLIFGGESSNTAENTLDGSINKSFLEYLANPNKEYTSILGKKEKGPDTSKPLFMHLGYHFPHTPVLPSKKFRDMFKNKEYDIPDYSDEEAKLLTGSLRDMRKDMDISKMTRAEKLQAIRDYYAFCAMGDKLVGDAISAFKKYCAEQNQDYTIVFVVGDHGWHLGEQGIEAKFGPWNKSNHGAVIVSSSNKELFPDGKVNNDFVEYVDFAPTFYDLAEVPVAERGDINGISLQRTLHNQSIKRDYVIGEMNQVRGDHAYLRSKDFAFSMRPRPYYRKPGEGYKPGENIRWGLDAPRKEVDMSLYDLRVDPNERVNVAYHGPYIELADFLRKKLGNIVLGDGRVEVDWRKDHSHHYSDFAKGAHNFKLTYPAGLVPKPSLPKVAEKILNHKN